VTGTRLILIYHGVVVEGYAKQGKKKKNDKFLSIIGGNLTLFF
jgi:hypothetical protein